MIAYAEARGNRPASRRFSIDEKRVREWRAKKSNIEGLLGSTKGKQRSRLSGGGRKPLSAKLKELLLEWIENRRARGLRVSCKLIMKKAEVTYRDMTENNLVDNDDFKASRGWLEKAKWSVLEKKKHCCPARSRQNGCKTCIVCNPG